MAARLTLLPHPFDGRERQLLELHAGRALRAELAGDLRGWAVTINGRPVPVEVLEHYELREGDLVAARAVPGDPGTIGLVIAAMAKAAATYFGASPIAASIVGAVAGAGATYAASRLLAPDVSQQAGAPASQPFYSVSGTRNQVRPFGVVPQHYGRLRVVPDLLAPPITSVSAGGVQTVRALFAVGVGRYSGVSSSGDAIRVGVQPIGSLGLKSFEVYTGLEDADPPSERLEAFATNVLEEPLGLALRHEAVVGSTEQIRTTAESALAFDVQLVFPQGIWRISDSGRQQVAEVRLVVRYREVGQIPWITAEDREIRGFIPEKFAENIHVDPAGAAQYEVSVQLRATMSKGLYTRDRGGGGGSTALTGDAIWTSLRSYLLGDAIIDEHTDDVTMFGVALDATELVSGTLDQLNVQCTRLLPTWTEADGWSDVALGERAPAAYTATRNPAWAFANELREAGVPDEEIDAVQIKAWADFCTGAGWLIDWQQVDEMTLDESLRTIASAGQAFPAPRGALFSVVYDADREPVAAFGPHNARQLVVAQTPIERVDAIRVRFVNGSDDTDGRLDERTLYFDGHTAATAEVYRSADVLNGLTDAALVERYMRLERLKAQRRSVSYQWQADWSAAVVEVGDVVLLQGAGALMGAAQSASTGYSSKNAGAHVDEVFVSPAVRIEAGRDYNLRVRTRARGADGGYRILSLPLTNPLTAGVQMLSALEVDGDFAVPTYIDDAAAAQPDDLVGQPVFVGEPDEGLVLVTEVRFEAPGTCSLSGVDFAPEIFSEPLLSTPHEPGISPHALANTPPGAPVLSAPAYSTLVGHSGTGYGYHGNYTYTLPLAPAAAFPPLSHYRVQHRYVKPDGGRSAWFELPDVAAPTEQILIGPLARILLRDLRIWAVSTAGAPSTPLLIGHEDL